MHFLSLVVLLLSVAINASPAVDSFVTSVMPYTEHAVPTGAATASVAADLNSTVQRSVPAEAVVDASYWLESIAHQGVAAFNPDPSYKVFRNVKDYGAKGDGVTDDTAAINAAMSAGGRFSPASRQSSTTTPAIVYFPAGTYVISTSIVNYYLTHIIGNPNSLPVIKATAGFTGLGMIDGDKYQSDGEQGWVSTNLFFQQVRNLILDMTAIPPNIAATGMHWPVAQASSLQNLQIRMTPDPGSQHQGLFIENGSGGFLIDVTITGGLYGANIGNQQFTMRNLRISNAVTGISQIWNWGWTYQGITITDCGTAFSMTNSEVGSVLIMDSTIQNCPVFVDTEWQSSPSSAGSLILENVSLGNVPVAVRDPSGTALSGSTGAMTITAWGQGHKYTPSGPTNFQGAFVPPTRPSALLASGSSKYYTKTKPQYEASPVSSFLSIRSAGATGDGSTDDTSAVQSALDSAARSGKILFFDQGAYKVTDTLYIPPGSRIVGEVFPVIMATGSRFADINQPVPVVQVGRPGDSGSVEWSEMMVSTQGPTPGALLIQWNLAASPGSGMWDVHTRIGGFAGSNLQAVQCPTSAPVTADCLAAYMSMHITKSARDVYVENAWIWTADHDLDNGEDTQISVYTGRGLLVEGKNIWLYATGVEHHSLYQFHFSGAESVVAGFIQTETPYYQPIPDAAHSPYPRNAALNDPDYSSCLGRGYCNALGLRVLDSKDITIYGAGLYSFFHHYSTACSDGTGAVNCQGEIFSLEGSSSMDLYLLSTVGTTNMIVRDGESLARYDDNLATYAQTIAYFTE